jgi:hypothetical protein
MHTLALLLLVLAADGVGWLLLLWQYQQRLLSWKMCVLFGLDLAVTAVDAAKATLRYAAGRTTSRFMQVQSMQLPIGPDRHCSSLLFDACFGGMFAVMWLDAMTSTLIECGAAASFLCCVLCSCTTLFLDEALAANPVGLHQPADLAAAAPPSAAAVISSRIMSAWQHWQGHGREAFFYEADLKADLAVHALTIAHHMHVWVLHGLSCQLFDALLLLDARNVLLSALKKLRQHKAQMSATSSLDAAFPDMLAGQPTASGGCASDNADADSEAAECVICREQMASAKQLPCGHLFHLQCLRAWLQQSSCSSSNGSSSFSCPMCRQPLLLPADAAAAAACVSHGRQQQQLLQGVSRAGGSLGGSRAGPSGAGASGFASRPSVRPSLMSSLSFGLLSPDELQPSAAAAAAAAAQHEARLEQLQDRADSWDRDDALMQQQLDSPGTEASYDDVALQEALVASLQDNAAENHASSSSRSSSRINSPSSASGGLLTPASASPSSHNSSCSNGYIVSPAAAGGCGTLVLPLPASPGVTAAATAAVAPVRSSHSSSQPQHQCRASCGSIAGNTSSSSACCSGSQSRYGSATSSCATSPQGQQQCKAAETFYACGFSDPLGGEWLPLGILSRAALLQQVAGSVCTQAAMLRLSEVPAVDSAKSVSVCAGVLELYTLLQCCAFPCLSACRV